MSDKRLGISDKRLGIGLIISFLVLLGAIYGARTIPLGCTIHFEPGMNVSREYETRKAQGCKKVEVNHHCKQC